MSAELGWAVKNGDLDKVKDFIELKASFMLKSKRFPYALPYIYRIIYFGIANACYVMFTFNLWEDVNFDSVK